MTGYRIIYPKGDREILSVAWVSISKLSMFKMASDSAFEDEDAAWNYCYDLALAYNKTVYDDREKRPGDILDADGFLDLTDHERSALLREALAQQEHDQWAQWSSYMIANMTSENVSRWRAQIETPYEFLSEIDKDKDRVFADQVLDIFAKHQKKTD